MAGSGAPGRQQARHLPLFPLENIVPGTPARRLRSSRRGSRLLRSHGDATARPVPARGQMLCVRPTGTLSEETRTSQRLAWSSPGESAVHEAEAGPGPFTKGQTAPQTVTFASTQHSYR